MEEPHLPNDCYSEIYKYLNDYQTIVSWFLTNRFFNAMIDEKTKERYQKPQSIEYIDWCHQIDSWPYAAKGIFHDQPVVMLHEDGAPIERSNWTPEVIAVMNTFIEGQEYGSTKDCHIWRRKRHWEVIWTVQRKDSYHIYTIPDLRIDYIDFKWFRDRCEIIAESYQHLGEWMR